MRFNLLIFLTFSTLLLKGCVTTFQHNDVFPARQLGALSGTAIGQKIKNLSLNARENLIFTQVQKGAIPDHLRGFYPCTIRSTSNPMLRAKIWVQGDYFAVGKNSDFLRIPLTPQTARRIGQRYGLVLPTKKMVDAIYSCASKKWDPVTIPPSNKMVRVETFLEHDKKLQTQMGTFSSNYGLMAGMKKDLVLTKKLISKPQRVAIYGWHQKNGKPIQPLSTIHGKNYVDYSHGIRFVLDKIEIDGKTKRLSDVLQNPKYHDLLSDEGIFPGRHAVMDLYPL